MFAAGAYWPPPWDAQVPADSQRATWSHSPSVAAPACPARATLPVPMTAPVKAIFATFTADAVGLRCRPLIGALGPLLCAPTRSAVGFGLERLPGRVGHGFTPRGRKRLLVLSVSVDRWVPRLHPNREEQEPLDRKSKRLNYSQ